MTSRAQMPLVRGRSHSENLTFLTLLCEQIKNEKRASDDETKKNIGQVKEFLLTKQKTTHTTDYERIGKTI